MKKNKAKIIGAIVIVLVLTLGIALSYAYFSASDKQGTANTFRSGCLNITIETESSAITLDNAYPISDIEGLGSKGYTFTIKNTCNKDTNYMINLESLNQVSNTLDSNYLKVALESDTMDNLISKLGDNPTTEALIAGAYEAHNLYNGTISANTSKEFTLREWIDYDVTKEQGMNKTVTNKINVIARPDLEVNELNIKSNINESALTGTLTNNVTDVKYCISNKNICEPNTNIDISENKIIINNLEDKKQLICTKLNNSKIYCVKKDKLLPILANEFLKYNANATDFESITVLDKINIPNNAIRSWDASEANNGSVMAYYLDENGNGLSELYLAGDGGVAAPQNSKGLFTNFMYENNEIVGGEPYQNVTTINLEHLDTSNVTDMSNMFNFMNGLTSLDVSNFDTKNVTNMNSMFGYVGSLTSLNLSNFDTRNVNNMSSMFEYMSNLNSLDISNFNTSNVITMNSMFNGMSSLISLDLSNFDTRNVTNMNSMFNGMSNLTSLEISNLDTSNVTNMNGMFNGMNILASLDLSNFDTRNVTNMSGMFKGMNGLTSLDLSNFDTRNVINMSHMFSGMRKIVNLDLSSFDTSKVTNMSNMFGGSNSGMTSITDLDLSNFDTSNVTDMQSMFEEMTSITDLDLSNFDTRNVTNMYDMFYGMSNLTSLDLSNADFSKVSIASYMFANASKLNTIKVKDTAAKNWIESSLGNSTVTVTPVS